MSTPISTTSVEPLFSIQCETSVECSLAQSTCRRWNSGRRDRLSDEDRRASLRSHRHAGDLGPGGKCLSAGGMKLGGGVLAWAAGEEVGDLIMDGKKPLHLPRRLEAFHDPLSSARRLVGILRPVVENLFVGSMSQLVRCRLQLMVEL